MKSLLGFVLAALEKEVMSKPTRKKAKTLHNNNNKGCDDHKITFAHPNTRYSW